MQEAHADRPVVGKARGFLTLPVGQLRIAVFEQRQVALPVAFALLQFQSFWPPVLVLAGVGLVQFVIGNILLPRLSSGTLNISLFVTLFSLFAWGAVWGVTGMFVAMPLTAILIITFSYFPATRPFAIALSRTGALDETG